MFGSQKMTRKKTALPKNKKNASKKLGQKFAKPKKKLFFL
jgi:hypothetical protein